MKQVAILGAPEALSTKLGEVLRASGDPWSCAPAEVDRGDTSGSYDTLIDARGLDSARYGRPLPDDTVLRRAVADGVGHFVVLSSAAINEPNWRTPCMLPETRPSGGCTMNPVPRHWLALEAQARRVVEGSPAVLTVLRPTATPLPSGGDYWSRLFTGRIAFTLPGFDPSLQVLALNDLAIAIVKAVAAQCEGAFNIAPTSVIPLRKALRRAGVQRIPVPGVLQRPVRGLAAKLGRSAAIEELDYIRYPWTVDAGAAQRELGFLPRHSSAESIELLQGENRGEPSHPNALARTASESFDPYGEDKAYSARLGKRIFRPLHDYYWRIEHEGIDNVPKSGRGILAGIHRGFQPWDAVMTLHLLSRELGRHPRFLIHPSLTKLPFLTPYISKLGGLLACQANAEYVIERDGLLGIYPEGIRGAFSYYRDAYRLGRFGRDDFVKLALRHQAPIIPFVTVGSAEIFPILGKFKWSWWKRYTEWPCFPITPTMGLVPLPSKWHTVFLEPLHVEDRFGPEAAADPQVVRSLSLQVRHVMERAIDGILARRPSIFSGSVFGRKPI